MHGLQMFLHSEVCQYILHTYKHVMTHTYSKPQKLDAIICLSLYSITKSKKNLDIPHVLPEGHNASWSSQNMVPCPKCTLNFVSDQSWCHFHSANIAIKAPKGCFLEISPR